MKVDSIFFIAALACLALPSDGMNANNPQLSNQSVDMSEVIISPEEIQDKLKDFVNRKADREIVAASLSPYLNGVSREQMHEFTATCEQIEALINSQTAQMQPSTSVLASTPSFAKSPAQPPATIHPDQVGENMDIVIQAKILRFPDLGEDFRTRVYALSHNRGYRENGVPANQIGDFARSLSRILTGISKDELPKYADPNTIVINGQQVIDYANALVQQQINEDSIKRMEEYFSTGVSLSALQNFAQLSLDIEIGASSPVPPQSSSSKPLLQQTVPQAQNLAPFVGIQNYDGHHCFAITLLQILFNSPFLRNVIQGQQDNPTVKAFNALYGQYIHNGQNPAEGVMLDGLQQNPVKPNQQNLVENMLRTLPPTNEWVEDPQNPENLIELQGSWADNAHRNIIQFADVLLDCLRLKEYFAQIDGGNPNAGDFATRLAGTPLANALPNGTPQAFILGRHPGGDLNINEFLTIKSTNYRLRGIAVYIQDDNALERGHYVTYLRDGNNWFFANDSTVIPVTSVVNNSYITSFYHGQDMHVLRGVTLLLYERN